MTDTDEMPCGCNLEGGDCTDQQPTPPTDADRLWTLETAIRRVREAITIDAIRAALDEAKEQPAEPATDWTPPPPGDTREQLPPNILDLIRPYLRGYTSTACQTAGYLAEATADQPEHRPELTAWRERMRARCRDNQKYTGEICPRHNKEPTP